MNRLALGMFVGALTEPGAEFVAKRIGVNRQFLQRLGLHLRVLGLDVLDIVTMLPHLLRDLPELPVVARDEGYSFRV